MNAQFTTKILDDVTQISSTSINDRIHKEIVGMHMSLLGPGIEYYYLQKKYGHLPALSNFKETPVSTAINTWAKIPYLNRLPSTTDLNSKEIELVSYRMMPADEAYWTAFYQRADKAAQASGFTPKISAGLVGALTEMADNLEHSELVSSSSIGYRFKPGEFEFVVADSGIGVLASLQKCAEYTNLNSHHAALELALSGKSRYGSNSGHGFGFRQVFQSMADLNGELRFRSGDQALEIQGNTPTLQKAVWKQRNLYQGFMISVLCRS